MFAGGGGLASRIEQQRVTICELQLSASGITVRRVKELLGMVVEAREELLAATGLDLEALFGERVLEVSDMAPRVAHAAGLIEGAAIALGVTALELLDEAAARSA